MNTQIEMNLFFLIQLKNNTFNNLFQVIFYQILEQTDFKNTVNEIQKVLGFINDSFDVQRDLLITLYSQSFILNP